MATSLAAQLAQIAVNSKSSLDTKARKAAHSKSLLFDPKVATAQSFQALYTICHDGFDELCHLDARFKPFALTLFSEQSQNEDRTQMSAAENAELDAKVDAFLRLVGSRIRLMPAIRAVEWLVRRFRIHEENTRALLCTFLPYHTIPAFVTLLSILPAQLPHEYRFLHPYVRSLTAPPRSVLVHEAIHKPAFLSAISDYTLEACRNLQHYPALISFWAGIMTEAVNGMLDNGRSGRQAVQQDNDQALLHRLGPVFGEAMLMKKVPNMQIATYMAVSIFASKGNLDDGVLSAFMEQIVHGWTSETMRPGLVCLSILAHHRSAKQMSGKVTKALIKVPNLGGTLVDIGRQQRVDKLAHGLCLALVERLCKKGDPRGLPVIRAVLTGQVIRDKQVAVVFKSLVLAAHRLNDETDPEGSMRKELGSALIDLSRHTGDSSDIIRSVIEEGEIDIEELEMKLDVSIRQQKVVGAPPGEDLAMEVDGAPKQLQKDVHTLLQQQTVRQLSLPAGLSANPGSAFEELAQLFLRVVAQSAEQPTLLEMFVHLPALRRQDAASDSTFVAFFIHIWCGPYPTLARAAALDAVKKRLQAGDMEGKDFQAMLPYVLVALLDSSRKVRRAAADLLARLGTMLPAQSGDAKKRGLWPGSVLFPEGTEPPQLEGEAVSRLLTGIVLPALEECVMHEEHLGTLFHSSLESGGKKTDGSGKKALSPSTRQSVFAWLAAHVTATPLPRVKSNLLSLLNRIKSVGSVSRTKLLLPAFRWWASLSADEVAALCLTEQLGPELLHERFAQTVVANDSSGLDFLLSVIQDPKSAQRPELVRSSFTRIRNMWPSMKLDTKSDVSRTMLELYQQQRQQPQQPRQQQIEQQKPSGDDQEGQDIIATEASDLLKNVDLTTDVLAHFLSSIQTRTKTATESPPSKRRRTSPSNADRGTQVYTPAELNKILRDITFVLQLVEGCNPRAHPELLHSLFDTLGELQRFSSVVGSELGYLQNLVLTSLIAMVPEYKDKTNKKLEIGSSGGYGDLLANCIQKTTSPIVQNSALLLIASLASAAPDVVLHSVMPIFTFMGASVLRQNDDYSAHVVNQTVKEVIPPLMASLRKGKRNPIAGATELLGSFVTAYEHIPSHRKQDLFVSLVNTLGPAEFLFALIAMLVDKYEASANIISFTADLLSVYGADVQLQTAAQLLALIGDIFQPRPELSSTLLGVGDDVRDKDDVHKTALRQLAVFPSLLSGKKLKKEIGELAEQDDMQTSKMRELYATLLKDTLALADVVKGEKDLHECCGSALANLLNLLSIGEFIKSVENLLDKTEMDLRRKVLRALEVRVDQEGTGDAASRTALLGFLPQLTAAIRDTEDLRYKRTAVASVDKIAEKYGKKDLEAVAAAATTIAGPECLGQPDAGLRVMALLCLASLVDVLQDGIVPVLSLAVPQAILYIEQSLDVGEEKEPHGELHNAGYAFITAVAQHLPYMVTGAYLDKIITASSASAATADLDDEASDSRLNCLRFLARKVEPKVFFAGLEKNWAAVTEAGYEAIGEFVDILSVAINSHPKSVIGKNLPSLSNIFLNALDLRRQMQAKGELSTAELGQIAEVESQLNEVALKMIYKLNDAAFRPVFTQMVEWPSQLGKKDTRGAVARRYSVYKFLETFFDSLKSIVTSYATYILEDAVTTLEGCDMKVTEQRQLWDAVLRTLRRCFEHDQDEFWQAPSHFGAVARVLTSQLGRAGSDKNRDKAKAKAKMEVDVRESLIPAVVELAAAADSQDHQKEINTAVLKQLRAEHAAVRLAAVLCQQALTDRLGEEWLASLPEMLPYISELQDDDDEVVERETHRWIVKIEGVLGESLDSMLQ
ncbi:BP28CT domain-containing protein [Sodiomyces alkalinus F11]|uniref:U3 small nucleolar RNA-associated protein 10 n=1 Tax=Sodiomyces alkalinus (strain CBS 110278 / VKM F-3762 / F11) TaxID=1314773 RepID=A0A3N2PWL8_SODAK|nr:BP28CT domain-containing protein [Sodiomyces alkalinus F11]ROT38786.1 BP28CT domain-containing protein [Sodiomyces alkalinus F11]